MASAQINFLIILFGTILTCVSMAAAGFFKNQYSQKLFIFSVLALFVIIGSFYYLVFENYQARNTKIAYGQKIIFSGVVTDVLEKGQSQNLALDLQSPHAGKILVKINPHPGYNYGDLIKFEGKIEKPEGSYATYLDKDKIYGISNFPKNEFISAGNGNSIKTFLFSIKEKTVSNFEKVLPHEKSTFLSGITLGERSEFSKEFKDQMAKSGTTHLVALSGYNISVLVLAVSFLLGSFLPKQKTFWLVIFIIISFVLMTGAQASVVRAAIMGGIVLLATQAQRIYSFRNAIAVAAFLMVLANPKILRFDIGFQLSFAALLGIVYLMPAINKFFKTEKETGLLNWKENLITTLSAQMAVFPILVSSFGEFSFLSLISNVLILSFIPLTMGLGFILGFLGMVSYSMSLVFSPIVNLFLSYELFIISLFGKINFSPISSISVSFAVLYYALLIFFAAFHEKIKPLYRKMKTGSRDSLLSRDS